MFMTKLDARNTDFVVVDFAAVHQKKRMNNRAGIVVSSFGKSLLRFAHSKIDGIFKLFRKRLNKNFIEV